MAKQYINPGPLSFTAVIQRGENTDNSSAWIEFPYDLKQTFGVGNLVPFRAVFDGRVQYQGSLAKMGGPNAMLLLRKDVRAELGKQPGETVEVVVELDDQPRVVVVPVDVGLSLETAGLLDRFEALAYTHRREYIEWIAGAKKLETRLSRIQKMCAMLANGTKSPR